MQVRIERLESLRLLSATLNGNTLSLNGTEDGDEISVELDGSDYVVEINSSSQSFAASSVNRIRIFANDGDDVITFGTADALVNLPVTVYGSGGNDTIIGHGSSSATFRVFAQGGNDRVTLYGKSRDHIYGEDGDDTIGSNGGRDYIFAGDSNDNINAGTGNDRIFAGSGNDIVSGGKSLTPDTPARDYIDAGEGNDTVNGHDGNDTIFGRDGNDEIFGGSGRDFLEGGEGVDTVRGQSGNDTVLGGGSNDILIGGPNTDHFAAEELDDEAQDYNPNIDTIQ